jgi:hypothetical protein
MSDELDRVAEQLRQITKWRESAARVSSRARELSTGPAASGFAPGARVFDTISGEEGEVIGGTRENVVVPAAK